LAFIVPGMSYGDDIGIPGSFNPLGSGARALGMGSAFIAVADDATAASWNPGGLVQLEGNEISIVGAFLNVSEDPSFGSNECSSDSQSFNDADINYLSQSYRFTLFKRNMVVSFNYQNLYDLNREWSFYLTKKTTNGEIKTNYDYIQTGGLSSIGLAYSIEIIPSLSFGFTFNFWDDGLHPNNWSINRRLAIEGEFHGVSVNENREYDTQYSFKGFNLNWGLLWHINKIFTFGAVVKTPFTANLDEIGTDENEINFNNKKELDMPMSFGLGLALRFSDRFTFSADIYRTNWQHFKMKNLNSGEEYFPLIDYSNYDDLNIDVDATNQIRMGCEYLFINKNKKYTIPLRGGIFYDPAPAPGSPDDYYGFSLGTGFAKGRFVFDMAIRFRFGDDVSSYTLQNYDFSLDTKEVNLYSSLIIHF